MFKEFKEFIAKGNVMDMAVGIILGAAFTTIVKSLVDDVLMPVIGVFSQGVDFSELFVALDGNSYETLTAAKEAGAAVVSYGVFVNAVINFLIVAFVVFILVKNVNKLKRKEEAKPAPKKPAEDIVLLSEIRDALVKKPAAKATATKKAPAKKATTKKKK